MQLVVVFASAGAQGATLDLSSASRGAMLSICDVRSVLVLMKPPPHRPNASQSVK